MDRFKTKSGALTLYALACGYLEVKTWPKGSRIPESEAYATLERHAGTNVLHVFISGRWARRTVYQGTSLGEARKAFRAINLELEDALAQRDYWRSRVIEARDAIKAEG